MIDTRNRFRKASQCYNGLFFDDHNSCRSAWLDPGSNFSWKIAPNPLIVSTETERGFAVL